MNERYKRFQPKLRVKRFDIDNETKFLYSVLVYGLAFIGLIETLSRLGFSF